jgi:hypothetical protein
MATGLKTGQDFSKFFWSCVFCAVAVVFICSARVTAASAAAAQAVLSYTPKEVGSCCDHNENNDYNLHDFLSALYLGLYKQSAYLVNTHRQSKGQ